MIACKAAIKAGDHLAAEEITALLEQRHCYQDAHHCPHGRPPPWSSRAKSSTADSNALSDCDSRCAQERRMVCALACPVPRLSQRRTISIAS